MKRLPTAYLLFSLALTLGACGQNKAQNDPKPLTKTELLTGKDWRLTAETVTSSLSPSVQINLYANSKPCLLDNLYRYETGGIYRLDEGPTKCIPTASQVTPGIWSFNADETSLTTNLAGSQNTSYKLISLTDQELKLTYEYKVGSIVYTNSRTYTRQ